MQHVGSSNEENLREIVFDVEIMVLEHVVLFRIQNFQQRRRRVAPEISRHLIHFVEHEHRVLGSGFLHRLNDLSWQRADIGAAMSADFSFITHSTQ